MVYLKSGCGCGCSINNVFAGSLSKYSKQLATVYNNNNNNRGSCGGACSIDRAKDCCGATRPLDVSERIQWLRRYRLHVSKSTCECRKNSPRDYWFDTNRGTILALSRAVGLHADVVSDFLYTLTMQNFAKVLNPRGSYWYNCHVPLCNFDTCDFYCGIFDSEGNVRTPYQPESLVKLLAVLQSVLKEGKESDNGAHSSLFGDAKYPARKFGPKPTRHSKKLTDRSGIGPNSLARQNGLRRRYKQYERYRLDGLDPIALWKPCLGPDWTFDHALEPQFRVGKPGAGNAEITKTTFDATRRRMYFGDKVGYLGPSKGLIPKATNGQQVYVGEKRGPAIGSSVRGSNLRNLLNQIKDHLGIERDLDDLVVALQGFDLKQARESEMDRTKGMARHLSNEYNEIIKGDTSSLPITEKYHNTPRRSEPTSARVSVRSQKLSVKDEKARFYYGAQVPILAHKPFDPDMPETWIRRHPTAARMDDKGNVVERGIIHRYRRKSVEKRLQEARKGMSIRSVYSQTSDVDVKRETH
ncbi:uncharacterized protein LOC135428462 [Drosophila montana]|uniref:uncharacterized protein LOC135428462 n=1 Tax=Drosophila montana TaxID=40370 RepID=UPI00313C29D6